MVENKCYDIKVIDNFLKQDELSRIKDVICCKNFPWYYSPNVAYVSDSHKLLESYFVHKIYDINIPQSSYYNIIFDIFYPKIIKVCGIRSLIRIKCNLYHATENLVEHPPHEDYSYPHLGAVFSLNTCNGFTRFGDSESEIVHSKENRMVFFDPSITHNSSNTTDTQSRININFNFL